MATSVVGAVRVVLGLDSATFTRGLSDAQRTLREAGRQMQQIGTRMSAAITAPIVGFGALSLKTAGDFEQAMNQVAAVSGATADDLAALREQARQLGATTQFSASQAAEAMGFLAMAGMEADDILSAMPDTLQLAAAAQMDMASAADIVTNILSGYNKDVSELASATDVLVKSFTSANTDLSQLAEAMKYAGPVASAAGVQFEEAAAALSLMGNAGIQGSMAGTSLRGAMSRMLNPTSAMASAMSEAGLAFTDASGRLLPLADIIEQLEPHADNAGLFMELFGQRAGPAMAALVSQGADSVRELTHELENSGGTAADIAAVQMEGFNGAMRELASAFEALQIAIADSGLLEWATEAVQALTSFLQGVSQTNPELLNFGVRVAAVAAAIGPVLVVLGAFAMAVTALISPVALVVAGIVALTAAVVAFWPEITRAGEVLAEFVGGVWQSFVDAWDAIPEKTEWVTGEIAAFVDAIPAFFAELPARMMQIGVDIIQGLWNGIETKWGEFTGWAGGLGEQVTGFFTNPLQIFSPSRRMHEIGVNVIEGLSNGMQSMQGQVQEVAGSISDSIAGMFGMTDEVAEQLALRELAEQESLDRRLEQLRGFYEQGKLLKSEYDTLVEQAHQEHANRMTEITADQVAREQQLRSQLIGHASSIFGSLSTLMKNFGEENLAASKAFAVAEAIVNTAQGITKALAQGGMFGFAGAAAVAMSGAAQISTILSARPGSRRQPSVRGGSSSSQAIPMDNIAQSGGEQTVVNLTLAGNAYSRDNMRELAEALTSAVGDGVSLNISGANA